MSDINAYSSKNSERRPSLSQLVENHGRVRGRTLLPHNQPVSYATNYAAPASPKASAAGPSNSNVSAGVNKIWNNMRRSISQGAVGKKPQPGMAVSSPSVWLFAAYRGEI
jgi:hypothetical protein